ncbi:MAG: hypothetical protein PVJ38_04785 [Candidatus Bathyarchaeota archaeon]
MSPAQSTGNTCKEGSGLGGQVTFRNGLKSEWLRNQVELLKSLHNYEEKEADEECSALDYLAEEGGERTFLRVIYFPDARTSNVSVKVVERTIEVFEEGGYDKGIVLAESFTSSAQRLLRDKEGLDYISNRSQRPYSVNELLYAIQQKTWELCVKICGGVPEKEGDCKGYTEDDAGGRYECRVRRISDDSDFHADMKWQRLLFTDFCKLVELEREP